MGGDYFFDKIQSRWTVSATGTTSATATKTAATNRIHVITSVSGSSDANSLVTVESPAATVIWQGRCAANGAYAMTFPPGVLEGAENAAVLVKTATGTSVCEANIAGFSRASSSSS